MPAICIFLDEAPKRDTAVAALKAYQAVCPPDRLKVVSGSQEPAFASLADRKGQEILEKHLDRMERRTDQGLCVWDGEAEDCWSFTIQGVPPQEGRPRASFCQALFPIDVASAKVEQLALLLSERIPFISGYGGLVTLFDAAHKNTAFDAIYAWAKRYPGLEVEDLNVTLPFVLHHVKGANWLTFVGNGLWSRLEEAAGGLPSFGPEIAVIRTPHGIILRAGALPDIGDRNRRRWPAPYAEVERALASLKVTEYGEFAGRFEEEHATRFWLNRFLEPGVW